MQEFQDQLRLYTPHLVAAVAILIIGYLVARIIGGVVQAAVRRLGIDRRLAPFLGGGGRERAAGAAPAGGSSIAAVAIGRVVFWVIMLFVLVAFFQELSLTLITQPLNNLLTIIFLYVPRIVGAAILVLIAWIVATVLRAVFLGIFTGLRLDQRVGGASGSSSTQGQPLSRSLSEAVYYLVFLFFLPTILEALGFTGLLLPVQHLIDVILAFIPNLFAAALLLLIGWFVARLVQRIVSSLLAAAGLDRFSDRVGIAAALGGQRLSALIGLILYILILLPIAIAALQTLQLAAITTPASEMLTLILGEIPKLLGAGITVAIAYVLGRVLAPIVTGLLAAAGFDSLPARLGIARATTGGRTPSAIVGQLVLVVLVLFALIAALQTIGFAEVAVLFTQFTRLAGHVLLGVVIFAIGLYLARLAATAIRGSGTANATLLAAIAQGAILVLVGAMALQQMGLGAEIITLAFGLTLGSIAVAAAIAFGVGGRQVAGQELERFVQRRRVVAETRRQDAV